MRVNSLNYPAIIVLKSEFAIWKLDSSLVPSCLTIVYCRDQSTEYVSFTAAIRAGSPAMTASHGSCDDLGPETNHCTASSRVELRRGFENRKHVGLARYYLLGFPVTREEEP
jgi:hypothetical protein